MADHNTNLENVRRDLSPVTYRHQFRWDSSVPEKVQLKGSFDNWKNPLELKKEKSGKFGAQVELEFGSRILYKYVVDGDWRHNPNEPTESDADGNINNVLQVPSKPSQESIQDSQQADHSTKLGPSSSLILPTKAIEPGSKIAQDTTHLENRSIQNSFIAKDPQSPALALYKSRPESKPMDSKPKLNRLGSSGASVDDSDILRSSRSMTGKYPSASSSYQARNRRVSYHVNSLLNSAPGTPSEKSTPADVSISNVVSALAGAAATAIPAAIFAATGKDIIRTPAESPGRKDLIQNSPILNDQTKRESIENSAGEPSVAQQQQVKLNDAEELSSEQKAEKVNELVSQAKGESLVDGSLQTPALETMTGTKSVEAVELFKNELQVASPSNRSTNDAQVEPIRGETVEEEKNLAEDTASKAVQSEKVDKQTLKLSNHIPQGTPKSLESKDAIKQENDTSIFTAPVPNSSTDQAVIAAGPSAIPQATTSLTQDQSKEGIPLPVETQSNTEIQKNFEETKLANQKNGLDISTVEVGSTKGSGSNDQQQSSDTTPKVTFPESNEVQLPSSPNEPTKRSLMGKRPSVWRHSIGSIRSSRRSSGEIDRKNDRKVSIEEPNSSSTSNTLDEGSKTTPRKRIPSLFSKIKGALSPNHKVIGGVESGSSSSSPSNLSKKKLFSSN